MDEKKDIYVNTKIFIGNLPLDVNEGNIREIFQQFGNILSVSVRNNPRQNKSYCCVQYSSGEEAENAINKGKGIVFGEREIEVQEYIDKGYREGENVIKGTNISQAQQLPAELSLIVSNIPFDIDKEQLSKIFSKYGDEEVRVAYENNGKKEPQNALVYFKSIENARKAQTELNEVLIPRSLVRGPEGEKKEENQASPIVLKIQISKSYRTDDFTNQYSFQNNPYYVRNDLYFPNNDYSRTRYPVRNYPQDERYTSPQNIRGGNSQPQYQPQYQHQNQPYDQRRQMNQYYQPEKYDSGYYQGQERHYPSKGGVSGVRIITNEEPNRNMRSIPPERVERPIIDPNTSHGQPSPQQPIHSQHHQSYSPSSVHHDVVTSPNIQSPYQGVIQIPMSQSFVQQQPQQQPMDHIGMRRNVVVDDVRRTQIPHSPHSPHSPQIPHSPHSPHEQFMPNEPPRTYFTNQFAPPSHVNRRMHPNLFVFHLPQSVDDRRLFQIFSPFGEVISVKVIRDESGSSKGYGFVLFKRFEEALTAIKFMDGAKLEHKYLKVSFKNDRGLKKDGKSRKKRQR